MAPLAIVIPAYKPAYLQAALDSVAAQTDRRFRVYIGDDAGPPEVGEICEAFAAGGLDLRYERFEQNLGRQSLTAHWNRCVALSREPWVWLFADDDVMEPGCVAAVHAAAEQGVGEAVLRFDTTVIGSRGEVLAENPRHPRVESAVDFVYDRLLGRRNSYVVEYVFRRDAFDRAGGFPAYPVAWCADDAAWFLFSRGTSTGDGKIRTLSGAKVRWRASGLNITDDKRRNQREKLSAAAQFLRFVEAEVRPVDGGRRTNAQWRDAAERWYVGQVRYLMPIAPRLWGHVLATSRGLWESPDARKLVTLGVGSFVASLRMLRGAVRRRLQAPADPPDATSSAVAPR